MVGLCGSKLALGMCVAIMRIISVPIMASWLAGHVQGGVSRDGINAGFSGLMGYRLDRVTLCLSVPLSVG